MPEWFEKTTRIIVLGIFVFGIIWFGAGFFKFTAKGDKNED